MNIHIFLKTLYYRTLIASLFHPLLHLVKAGLPPHVEKTKTYKRIYIYTYKHACTYAQDQGQTVYI